MRRLMSCIAIAAMAGMALAPRSAAADDGGSFVSRFVDNYAEHMKWTGEGQAPSPYRGSEPPLDSPPFPGVDYSFGGSQVIGHTSVYGGPLTDTIWASDWGQSLKDNNIAVYGWLEPGVNFSSARNKFSMSTGSGGNAPMVYGSQPNTIELDQFALYFEKVPDEVQTDHIDWGFRVTNLYGEDYRYTFSHDDNSSQRIKKNQLYGMDPCLMCYVEIYVPQVAEGMQIRVGRYISIPDIEAQLAPNNYTYTHSLVYSVDPYTQTGIVDTIKFSKNWTLQLELSGGNDVMPWDSRYTQLTPAVCVQWTSNSGGDVIYPCMNGLNNQQYGYNNLQHQVLTWYHKFNSKWHMDTEAYYMWQRNVPNANWDGIPTAEGATQRAIIPGPNSAPAVCAAWKPNCYSRDYAMVNYINYEVDRLNSISFRNEFYDDANGQRMGTPTWFSEHMIGWQHWIGDVITIRPEIAFAKSYTHNAFDALYGTPTANHVLMFSSDVVLHF